MLNDCIALKTTALAYNGPERRAQRPSRHEDWLSCMLDEMDYGMLLVDASGTLRHANQPGRRELACETILTLAEGTVCAADRGERPVLLQALAEAARGRRRLISIGRPGFGMSIAVVPLGHHNLIDEPRVLLILGKRLACETLTLDIYARSQGLTGAETRVLQALCKGLRPKDVAREFDVAVSTVRTQISSIRHKTQTNTIRDLVNRVVSLPPITSVMKSIGTH